MRTVSTLCLCICCLTVADALAQTYPAKPVRVVVAFVPGGADDFHGRLIAQKLGEQFGSQFIVDNRGSAGGLVGWESVARAPVDGYTLLLGGGSLAIAPSLRRNLSSDVLRDFTPVSLLARFQLALVVHPSVPAKSVKELTSWYAIIGSAGLPKDILARLHEAMVRAVGTGDTRDRLIHAGSEPVTSTPEQLTQIIRDDVTRFARIVRLAGIQPE